MDMEDYDEARLLEAISRLVAIPSVSSDPERTEECRRAAAFLGDRLRTAGSRDVAILECGGPPVVYGSLGPEDAAEAVLVYGHYDVQPASPEGWTSPPFAATVRDGRLYGRGATDDKGNVLLAIAAAESLSRTVPGLPTRVKFLIEGEEEIGSAHLDALLEREAGLLSASSIMSADGSLFGLQGGSLTVSARGAFALSLEVTGPASDVHSGMAGGSIASPVHALAALVASLHGPDGSVSVPGFLEGVLAASAPLRAELASVAFDEASYLSSLGVNEGAGEGGYSTLERLWIRPSLDVVAFNAGHAGPGMKAVIPARAKALVIGRAAPGQDPERLRDRVIAHLESEARLLRGVGVHVAALPFSCPPYEADRSSPAFACAVEAMSRGFGQRPALVRCGASIPLHHFERRLGAVPVIFSFSRDDENAHGPDEFVRLSDLEAGFRAWRSLFSGLGGLGAGN